MKARKVPLARGVLSVPPATGTGHVRFLDRLGSSSAATAARQPAAGLHPKAPAVGTRYPRFRDFRDAPPQADLAGRRGGEDSERIAPYPAAERATHGKFRLGLTHHATTFGSMVHSQESDYYLERALFTLLL